MNATEYRTLLNFVPNGMDYGDYLEMLVRSAPLAEMVHKDWKDLIARVSQNRDYGGGGLFTSLINRVLAEIDAGRLQVSLPTANQDSVSISAKLSGKVIREVLICLVVYSRGVESLAYAGSYTHTIASYSGYLASSTTLTTLIEVLELTPTPQDGKLPQVDTFIKIKE